jgi:SNF2 family DNA or RNA helicase
VFGRTGLVLHGGVSLKKRAELVEEFNGTRYVPYLVVSVKAGGVGLNLTAANHVVHFDRWWNPAVENQATDRAFRIGQKKPVVVYKFVTSGTLEEKIDALLQRKSSLSEQMLEASASIDSWLTNLDDKAILDLVRLGGQDETRI